MLLTEYNEAEVMELFEEDGRREGIQEGMKKGRKEGSKELQRGVLRHKMYTVGCLVMAE